MAGKVLNISLNATITPLQKALESVGKMMNDFAASIEKTDKKMADSIRTNVADMNASLDKVKQSFVNTEKAGDKAGKNGTTSLRTQLRQATQEAQMLAETVGTTDPKFIAAASKAAELKDKIGDTQLAIDAMNPDEKFKGVANLMGGLVSIGAGLQGAMAAFGVESENATKAIAKLQGLMALAQGFNALGGLKDAMGAVKTQVIGAAQSMGTFKTALVATGIGAAVVLIGLLAANWEAVSDAVMGTSDKTRAYKMAQEEVTKAVGDAQAKFYEAQNAIDSYKKGLISKEQALKVYNETAGEMIGKTNNILEADRNLENNVSVYLKMMEHKTRAQVLFAKAAEQSAKISSGEAAEVGFWESVGNMLLSGTNAYAYASKQVSSSANNIQKSQNEVNKLLKVANEDMSNALKLEKQLGDVKGANAKFDAAHKPTTGGKNLANENAKMFASMLNKQKEYNLSEQLLREETGLSILEIDRRYAEISEKYKISDSKKVLEMIKKQFDEEKKLQDDKAKTEQQEQMDKAKRMQENLNLVEQAASRELEVRKKTGLSAQVLDQQFERIRRENSKLSNEEIYAEIEKTFTSYAASQQMAIDSANAFNQSLQSMASQGITMAAEAIGTALAGGAVSMADIFSNLILMVADTASQLGKQFIAMGTAALVVETQLLTNPPAAIAAGAVLVALAAGAKQIMKGMGAPKKMEQGGLVYGNSFLNVGEYGSAHSNPEVIAPLSKLKQLLPSNQGNAMSLQGVIQGNNLQVVSAKQGRTFSRITGRKTL
jgi:hypothetical protein